MDSLTHIAIGACIGELFLGKKIGKKAMLYGAVAASLPDIDFVTSFWLKTPSDLLAHRGFTHSIFFACMVIAVLALFFRKRHAVENISIKTWLLFLGISMASHLFLDAFNAYGIGWFEPFSHYRISFNMLFVADPFFSLWPGLAALVLLIRKSNHQARTVWARYGLVLCALYLGYALINKYRTDNQVQLALHQQGIHYNRFFTTPTPFNNWLWWIVAETDSGYYTGYRSVFDKPGSIRFHFFPQYKSLLESLAANTDLQELIRFSQGYYTASPSDQGVVFNDLRFGQMRGWENPEAGFVFHFYLQRPDDNQLVVQRGRFAGWNRQSVLVFIRRMRGN